jgi:hypothetical protein
MKILYVLGKFENKGVSGDDSSSLDSYMELGWEIMGTGLWAKNNLSEEDGICTTSDRLFMYEHITDNLVAYEDLLENEEELNKEYGAFHALYRQKNEILRDHNEREWTKNELDNMVKNNIPKCKKERDFVCVQIRNRDHCEYRGGKNASWVECIKLLSSMYSKVYIVGKGNEKQDLPANTEIVNLKKYCSLIRSENCVASFGPSSGCMMLNYVYGRKELPVHILFTEAIGLQQSGHILYFADRTNLAKVKSNFHFDFDSIVKEIQKL